MFNRQFTIESPHTYYRVETSVPQFWTQEKERQNRKCHFHTTRIFLLYACSCDASFFITSFSSIVRSKVPFDLGGFEGAFLPWPPRWRLTMWRLSMYLRPLAPFSCSVANNLISLSYHSSEAWPWQQSITITFMLSIWRDRSKLRQSLWWTFSNRKIVLCYGIICHYGITRCMMDHHHERCQGTTVPACLPTREGRVMVAFFATFHVWLAYIVPHIVSSIAS